MLGIIIRGLWLLIIPILSYVLWLWFLKKIFIDIIHIIHKDKCPKIINQKPKLSPFKKVLIIVFAVTLLIIISLFMVMAIISIRDTGKTYEPAKYHQGIIIPAKKI